LTKEALVWLISILQRRAYVYDSGVLNPSKIPVKHALGFYYE
jgi:hypothetical protein